MSRFRVNSSPDLHSSDDQDESVIEAMAANVKLLLKPIQVHFKQGDGQKPQLAEFSSRKLAELRRCNTDLRRRHPPKDKRQSPPPPRDFASAVEEIDKLRRELLATMTARKSLEKMFSSLAKEKQMIATELAVKVHECTEMEELVSDLKAQNESLMEKVKACAADHKSKRERDGEDVRANAALQEKNKVLADQLLKSLDGYRSLKRRFKDAQEEQARLQSEMAEEAAAGIGSVRSLRERLVERGEGSAESEKELAMVERMLVGFQAKVCSNVTSRRGRK